MKTITLTPVSFMLFACFSAEDLPLPPPTAEQPQETCGTSPSGAGASPPISMDAGQAGMGGASVGGGGCGTGGTATQYTCRGMPVPYAPMCDDGNDINGDACTSDCKCGISNSSYFGDQDYGGRIIAYSSANSPSACYILILKDKNWFDAQIKCAQAKLQLAVIESSAELDMLHTNMKPLSISLTSLWIGAHRYNANDNANEWRWLHGGTLSHSNNPMWGMNGSSNGGSADEDCVQIVYSSEGDGWHGHFNNKNCSEKINFLCRTPATLTQ